MSKYVKFVRGTPDAYANSSKQNDTLYFISEPESNKGVLYLGNKIIGGSSTVDFNDFSINTLKDVLISEELTDKSLLVYSVSDKKWVNADFEDLIFIGATQYSSGVSGFVPAPLEGQVNLFLRSDGTWASIATESSQVNGDQVSIDIYDNQLALKNYGKKYYKYNQETEDYEILIVDKDNPWKEKLEPKVVNEDGQLILGWFEPKVDIEINNIKNTLDNINNLIGVDGSLDGVPSSGIFAKLDLKANIDSVFTKTEVENKIQTAIAAASFLERVIVSSVEDIDVTAENSKQYIYLIASGLDEDSNKYYEYIVVEDPTTLQKTVEKIGSWTVDLKDYAKKEEILIKNVDTNFQIVDGTLSLNKISIAKIDGLESVLDGKLTLSEAQSTFVTQLSFNNSIKTLEDSIGSNASDIETLIECLTWQELE